MQKRLNHFLILVMIGVWLSHLLQVFTPEVGFDALWYHLPVVKAIAEQQKLVFLPNLYQSVNPLGSDLFFGIGFILAGSLGTKLVAYIFGLLLVISTYLLSRRFFDKTWALAVVILISTYQVVAWQAASFYVDVAKAFWEITALLYLVKWHQESNDKWLFFSSFLWGMSLATKLFSLFLQPVFMFLLFFWRKKENVAVLSKPFFFSFLLPFPFYIFSFIHTGHLFFSFHQHLIKLAEIGGESSLVMYVWRRSLVLPSFFQELIFAKDYTSFLLVLFLPVMWKYKKQIWQDKILAGLAVFTIVQVGLWWYLPPLSTRYALSGFITWMIISIWSVQKLIKDYPQFLKSIAVTIFFAVMINLVPRLVVNWRSWLYISHQQTQTEYLYQFLDGNVDQHLKKWYRFD